MSPPRPRKRFGQHFLTDPGVIDAILNAIDVQSADCVVEIGPGRGAITRPLAASASQLHLIELDRDLVRTLEHHYRGNESITVHAADALEFDFSSLGARLRIVGNLPYNISTPLLFHLVEFRDSILDLHFMLQKEVVDRMAAAPGSKAYGRLGIMLGCFFSVESLFDVEPGAFEPPPSVTSAVVRLAPLPADHYSITDVPLLSKIVATAFAQRRKTLRNALSTVIDSDGLKSLSIDPSLRPEAISIGDYVRLANHIAATVNP